MLDFGHVSASRANCILSSSHLFTHGPACPSSWAIIQMNVHKQLFLLHFPFQQRPICHLLIHFGMQEVTCANRRVQKNRAQGQGFIYSLSQSQCVTNRLVWLLSSFSWWFWPLSFPYMDKEKWHGLELAQQSPSVVGNAVLWVRPALLRWVMVVTVHRHRSSSAPPSFIREA